MGSEREGKDMKSGGDYGPSKSLIAAIHNKFFRILIDVAKEKLHRETQNSKDAMDTNKIQKYKCNNSY